MPDLEIHRLHDGIRYGLLGAGKGGPAPLLLVFAAHIEQTLGEEPYVGSGRLLLEHGFVCAALDLPCHGEDQRAGETNALEGWRRRMEKGESVIPAFASRVSQLLDHLVASGVADPGRVAAAGISRGGFVAFHAAAADPRIRAISAFGTVSNLTNLREFHGMEADPSVSSLSLIRQAPRLVDRSIWVHISNNDERVGTSSAVAAIMQIVEEAKSQKKHADVELHISSVAGHNADIADAHPRAAAWIRSRILKGRT